MKLLKSEKHRTEKASMIYNWLRTPPQHACEFRYGSTCLRQERRQEHIPPVSPQPRQDTKGTCQSQAGTWSPFKHGTTASLGFYRAIPCFARRNSDLQRPVCSLQDLLQCSLLLQCLDLVHLLLGPGFYFSQKLHNILRWGLEKDDTAYHLCHGLT